MGDLKARELMDLEEQTTRAIADAHGANRLRLCRDLYRIH